MLTKEERAAIAARVASYDGGILTWTNLYECLLDAPITGDVSLEEDSKYVIDCLVDLCDTSNMIELPLDKDGEVIHIGDVVYAGDKEWKVSCVKYSDGSSIISVYSDNGCTEYRPDELTHKKLGTIESLVERLEIVLAKGQLSAWAVAEISDIVNQLEKLGDSDD